MVGGKLDRFFLRMFRLPTKKVIESCYYDPAAEPPPRYSISKDLADYVIDVFISGEPHCLMTETSGIAIAGL